MLKFYFTALAALLYSPRRFFEQLPLDMGLKRPAWYLMASSLVFAAASGAWSTAAAPMARSTIFWVNAVGMTLVSALLGHGLIYVVKGGAWTAFNRVFSVYAFSTGTTLLGAWVPWFVFVTEPWKWWLICIGMTRVCRLTIAQAAVVIGVSIGLIVFSVQLILGFLSGPSL